MYERFTERARQVVVLAQDEAKTNHHAFVEVPHILVGLLREESGLAALVMKANGITIENISYSGIPELARELEDTRVPMAASVKEALELALREALGLGHNYIGTEHILLGVLRLGHVSMGGDLQDDVSRTYGLPENLRDEVMRALSGPRRAKPAPTPEPDLEERILKIIGKAVNEMWDVLLAAVRES